MSGLPQQLPTFWLQSRRHSLPRKTRDRGLSRSSYWMAEGKSWETQWVLPLSVDSGIHAFGTLAIRFALTPALSWLAIVDDLPFPNRLHLEGDSEKPA